jgi:subtilase family serine protease
MRFWKYLLLCLAPALCFAAQPDRIGPIDSSQKVALKGNVHGLAQSHFDIGRTDGSMILHGVTLTFRPSASQQMDLDNLLAQQQDRSSPNYHKWLTPAQFADRFGMTESDIATVTGWIESQGLTVTSVANSRSQISFEGTVAQIESTFNIEIHDYIVDGEIHFANTANPSIPASLVSSVLGVSHLHNFLPHSRAKVRQVNEADPEFTSYVSGNHFLAPGDFATIYDVQSLYNAGTDGTGQKIALTGQSSINLSDVANFRSNSGLTPNVPTLLLVPGEGTSTRCAGDEGESDLDVEWSGGIARNANITLVYAGLVSGDTCKNRQFGAFDALQYAIDQNIAPVISNSYGNCEAAAGPTFEQTMRGWIQQANAQGQTVITAAGDSGAADCDYQVKVATQGFAVDLPAAIPEVTGMGGTAFSGDSAGTVSNGNAGATSYWSGTSGGVDNISSALSYIPEVAWNDSTASIAAGGDISASGGGASIFFPKPSWQTGTGVPADGERDVPDLALSASPEHDGYLFCSEDGAGGTIATSCASGFRVSSGGNLTVVGGTSVAAPTFAGIIALLNQQLSASGLGNVNPTLYSLAASNPGAFHDITTGNNIVPCTNPSTDCPTTSPFQFGFNAGTGYDQVTGLGSIDAAAMFAAWPAARTASSVTIASSASAVNAGSSVTFKAAISPSTGVGTVKFSTSNNGNTVVLGTAPLNSPYPPSNSGTASFTTSSLPGGINSVSATYEGDAVNNASTSASPAQVTVSDFSVTASALTPGTISAGQSASATLTLTPVNGSTQTINFTNSISSNTGSSPGSCTAGLPTGALCAFSPTSVTLDGIHSQTVTLVITTLPNMALGSNSITVTGTASGTGGTSHTASFSLTVTATTESFTLAPTNGSTFAIPVGGTASVQLAVSSSNGFVNSTSSTTVQPLNYTCAGLPASAEVTCLFSPNTGQQITATTVTLNLMTTPKTVRLNRPFDRNPIFYALLLPGLFGVLFVGTSGTRTLRLLALIVVLGCSTLWLGACGGSSGSNSLSNSGSPVGTYTVTVTATTGGATPLVATSPAITLSVTP